MTTLATAPPTQLLALLARSDCIHLPQLVDLSGAAGSYLPILEPLEGPQLESWLHEVERALPGEAVTVAIALVRAVAAVHRGGLVGVLPDAASIRFRADGCPVLCGFAALEPMREAASARPDWIAVAQLLDRLGLGTAPASHARGVDPVGAALAAVAAHESAQTLAALEDAVFAVAQPEPVDLVAQRRPPLMSMSGTSALPPGLPALPDPAASRARLLATRLAEAIEAGPSATITPLITRARGALSRRMRLLLVAASVATGAVLLLLAALPDGSDGDARTAAPHSTGSPAGSPQVTARSGDAPAATPDATRDLTTEGAEASAPVDPVDAASALFAGFSPSLIERDGGTALIALKPVAGNHSRPETALLIDTADGWRIRRVFEG